MEKIAYGGWPNCLRLSNGRVELVATTDVGPRIIRFALAGQDNEFHEDPAQVGKVGGDEWMGFGGHRLWHAPEVKPRTYYPDNGPVAYSEENGILHLTQDTETTTGINKEILISLDPGSNHVHIEHRLTNTNLWSVKMAPWALSVMAAGGKAIIPQEPYSPHPDIPDFPGQVIHPKYYLPVRTLVLWSYTKLSDPRWEFTDRYLMLSQRPEMDRPQKLGISNHQGWAAYARGAHLFVKKTSYIEGARYPDGGCNFEVFTNADMLEMETLGPMTHVEPGATVAHHEDWFLFDGVRFEDTDESLDANVLPKVRECL